jgi:hypothetical protein
MDQKTVLELLIRCVVKGQANGVFSIKDASSLYDIILHLKETKVNEEFNEKDCYASLVRAVVLSHSKGVYTLEEASVIDKVIVWLSDNGLVVVQDPLAPSVPADGATAPKSDVASGVKEV